MKSRLKKINLKILYQKQEVKKKEKNKTTCWIIVFIWNSRKGKNTKSESKSIVASGCRQGGKFIAKGHENTFREPVYILITMMNPQLLKFNLLYVNFIYKGFESVGEGGMTSLKCHWHILNDKLFVAAWMDLEIIILSEVRQRQISQDISYIESLK